jgi:hypothetical protein
MRTVLTIRSNARSEIRTPAPKARIRLGRDYYARVDASDYSVDPTVIGRLLDVHADLNRFRSDSRAGSLPSTPGSGPAV